MRDLKRRLARLELARASAEEEEARLAALEETAPKPSEAKARGTRWVR